MEGILKGRDGADRRMGGVEVCANRLPSARILITRMRDAAKAGTLKTSDNYHLFTTVVSSSGC